MKTTLFVFLALATGIGYNTAAAVSWWLGWEPPAGPFPGLEIQSALAQGAFLHATLGLQLGAALAFLEQQTRRTPLGQEEPPAPAIVYHDAEPTASEINVVPAPETRWAKRPVL